MSSLLFCVVLLAAQPEVSPADPKLTAGPVLGRMTPSQIHVWCRADAADRKVTGVLLDQQGEEVCRVSSMARTDSDLTVDLVFEKDVQPGTAYRYRIELDGQPVASSPGQQFETPSDEAKEARLVFGSCANKKIVSENGIWQAIRNRNPHQLVFLGDTPYIDSTDLEKQRAAHREFWNYPGLDQLVRSTAVASTWDDHDYGVNDAVGIIKNRENARQAFLEYHPLGSIGDGQGGGVYTSFRRGPVEVFLLDTRWYGKTEPSPLDPEKTTLLGASQWEWLRKGLKESTAPFKIISSGMIFNGSVRPGKKDHWMQFPHERNGLLKFIGQEKISGVLIVTGDIHRCRHLSYPGTEGAGYPIDEWITSPLGNFVIDAANVAHPSLVFDGGEKAVFLSIEAKATGKDAELWSRLIRADGEVIHQKRYQASGLKP